MRMSLRSTKSSQSFLHNSLTRMKRGMSGPRTLNLSENLRQQLIRLRKLSEVTDSADISSEQIESVEDALNCEFPDSIIALFANGDDGLYEQRGVKIEDVFDNTKRAHKIGHPKDMVAIGCHPDEHCFYCVSKQPPNQSNPGITEYDNFDGSSSFYSLTEWLKELLEEDRHQRN
jgi:hypothetical protein